MNNKLKWRFDASTFKLLGRGLITDRITAIYELVKNSYDADATSVELEFNNIEKRNAQSKIIIKDNGQGMSLDDIVNKWLVVGTSSKRKNPFTPLYKRRYIGEKGVGRFATDKLGEHLRIKTKQLNDTQILEVTINWKAYETEIEKNPQTLLFTDLENEYRYIDNDTTFQDGKGTELCITLLHEAWDKEMLLRLQNQLTRILSPFHKPNPPFDISLYAPQFHIEKGRVESEPIEQLATVHIIIDNKNNKQGCLKFNTKTQEFDIVYTEAEIFGLISLQFYYFNAEAQKDFKTQYKGTQNNIEGVKIYRDGVICTPFAEYESVVDKRRDILGIDKRRHVEAFDKLSSREVIGIVEITKQQNPEIRDATNRQDFDDTQEYRRLKEFIIEQLDELVKYKFAKRAEKKEVTQNNLKRATADVKNMATGLRQLAKEKPELKETLAPFIKQAENAANIVSEGAKDKEEEQKDFLRKENLYLSLMSLQDYAIELAHGIRFANTPVLHAAELFLDYYPNPKYEEMFKKYPKIIHDGATQIKHLVDYMLSYTQIELEDVSFSIKNFLYHLLFQSQPIVFEQEKINVQIDILKDIELTGNKKFLEDVLTNLISNSIKALKNKENKIIKCEVYSDNDNLYILFSDNGYGVADKVKLNLFEMFKTTTADEGGAGFGLYIARTRMTALHGTIELISSIFNPEGATFKITLPLKK